MRIVIDKTRLQALMVAVPLILIAAAGAYYYFVIRPRYGVSHDDFLIQDTAVRAVAKPVLVQSYVSSLAHVGTRYVTGVPRVSSLQQFSFRTEWVHKMPFEFSFLMDQRSPDYLGVQLFVQEHPTSESFADLVNDTRFFRALHPIRWDASRMNRRGAAQLLATGNLPIPADYRDAVSSHFPEYTPFDAPDVSGRHFIEVAVENRNGALMELHGAFSRVVGLLGDRDLEDQMFGLWPEIQSARVTVDLAADDLLRFEVKVECHDDSAIDAVADVLDWAGEAVGNYLATRYGFQFQGRSYIEAGRVVSGVYDFSGFEARLRRALGG